MSWGFTRPRPTVAQKPSFTLLEMWQGCHTIIQSKIGMIVKERDCCLLGANGGTAGLQYALLFTCFFSYYIATCYLLFILKICMCLHVVLCVLNVKVL